ncbi:MAG TPA: hypothetical protein VHX88_18465 [Solirubrobacteraceae bacterium]|jgi:hypothetical protein|nr:hypothetical protein [Solirubrobacteraceae bacterium]
MKLLVVTTRTIDGGRLREAVGSTAVENAEVMVVAPALHENGLRFWLSDADEAIAKAQEVESETVDALRAEGIPAAGDTGESELPEAIADALVTFPADRILLFRHPGDDGRYREDVDVDELRERLTEPIEVQTVLA